MCPHAHNEPAFQPKQLGLSAVPRDVCLQLRPPPPPMLLWPGCVPRAYMPEAAVDEDDDAGSHKHQVCSNRSGCRWN